MILIGSFLRSLHYKLPALSNFFLAPFLMHADFLFSGCFLAFMSFYNYEKVISFINRVSTRWVYCSVFFVWLFSKFEFHPTYDSFFILTSGAVINICISFLIIYFIFKSNTIGYRFLNHAAVAFIGKLSYSLYIWQQLFISKYDFWWSRFPQNIGLTFLVAYLSFIVIEKPFLRLKDRFKSISERRLSTVDV